LAYISAGESIGVSSTSFT